jgi:DNA-binding LytR/AlgR family response regulator
MPAMQSRARFAWREVTGRSGASQTALCVAAESMHAPAAALPAEPVGCDKPAASSSPAPFKSLAPQNLNGMLEGFCPEPPQEEQIAVNSKGLMLSLRLADIEWMEAADNYVKLHVGKQTHRLRDTLAVVVAKLPPGRFLRISRSTLVNIEQISGLQPMFFDEYEVLLRNGTRLTLTRAYFENLRQSGLPLADSIQPMICPRLALGESARN